MKRSDKIAMIIGNQWNIDSRKLNDDIKYLVLFTYKFHILHVKYALICIMLCALIGLVWEDLASKKNIFLCREHSGNGQFIGRPKNDSNICDVQTGQYLFTFALLEKILLYTSFVN